MLWKPLKDEHIIYEAISALADKRFEMISENKAKSYSTSGNKFYEIEYDPKTNSMMSNDNMAYYTGTLSYPMISFLLSADIITYNKDLLEPLKRIKWKDINQKNKNDYMKSVEEVLEDLKSKGYDKEFIVAEIDKIYKTALKIKLNHLGKRRIPPKTY